MKCKLTDISKSYNGRTILDHISYDFSANGMYVLYGKSGIGKTTLLNILCGYEQCDQGKIETEDSQVVYALQNYELLDTMSVDENLKTCVAFYPDSFEDPSAYMKALKVDHLIHQYPNELSKGQKQRIMIVKALCRRADIYLFDEPTSALDKASASAVMELLYEKAKTSTVIVVTHDLTHIVKESTTLLEMKQGKIIETSKFQGEILNSHVKPIEIKQTEINTVMKSIIKKQSRKTILLYSLFSFAIIIMLLINIRQYQWKVYDDLYESEYLYIKDPAEYERTMKDSHSIINFLAYDTGTNTFPINAVPSHHEQDKEKLKDGGIIINQNTAQFLAGQYGMSETELIGKQFRLNYVHGTWINEISFEIREIITEKDAHTRAMAYYNSDDLKQRIDNYDEINTIQYELKGDSAYLEKLFNELYDQRVEVFHPMLSDKYELSRQGSAEDIILWLLIGIIYLFYMIFIYITNQNNWKYHLTSNIILVNDGVPCDSIRYVYQRLSNRGMLMISVVSSCACAVCFVIEMHPVFLIFAVLLLIPYFLNRICLRKNSGKFRKQHIADLLKASQEVK